MAKQKYYTVWAGHKPGIYTVWAEAEKQVRGFANAKYKSFPTELLAEQAFKQGVTSGTRNKAPTKHAQPARADAGANAVETDVAIYCDGACDPNPGKAGTGIAIYKGKKLNQLWYGLYNPAGTNNTAELLGLYHSLTLAKGEINNGLSIAIHCDSTYAINCVTKWADGWKAKGWKKKNGEIKNLDIIKPAHALYVEIAPYIQIQHVSAHSGIEGNELADRMSVIAIERRELDLVKYTDALSITEILSMARG